MLHAAVAGHAKEVALVLEKGADLDLTDDNDNSPLMMASYNCNSRAVEFLIHAGADINSRNHNNQTPLKNATDQGCKKTITLLLGA